MPENKEALDIQNGDNDVDAAVETILHELYDRLVEAHNAIFKWRVISAFLAVMIVAMAVVVVLR